MLDNKASIPAFYATPNQPIKVAYDFSHNEGLLEPWMIELIQVAAKQFSQITPVILKYEPISHETKLSVDCPVNEKAVRKEHSNRIIFQLEEYRNDSRVLGVTHYSYSLAENIHYSKLYEPNMTDYFVSSFGSINLVGDHPNFRQNGVGIIFHEIFHLFGLNDWFLLDLNCTQGILQFNTSTELACQNRDSAQKSLFEEEPFTKNITESGKKIKVTYGYYENNTIDELSCLRLELLKESNYDNCENYDFSLSSLFSVLQYSQAFTKPYFFIDKIRITELLVDCQFNDTQQRLFFDLVTKFQGKVKFAIRQDFAELVEAIYSVAPLSLESNSIHLPTVYFIEGSYISFIDRNNIQQLLIDLNNCNPFPLKILSQEFIKKIIYADEKFSINLLKELKVVLLESKPITCSFINTNTSAIDKVFLADDCWLVGDIPTEGNYTLLIKISNNSTAIYPSVFLTVKPEDRLLSTVLVGKPVATFKLTGRTITLDLEALCEAAAFPRQENLQCASTDLPENLSLIDCYVTGFNQNQSHQFNVSFYTKTAEKNCCVQIFPDTSSSDSSVISPLFELPESNSNFSHFEPLALLLLSDAKNESFSANYVHHSYPFVDLNQTSSFIITESNDLISRYLKQFNYLITTPFLHGVVEGYIDVTSFSIAIKSILKFLPRLVLVGVACFSTSQIPFLFLYSVVQTFLAEKLPNNKNNHLISVLKVMLFLIGAELEYGFSDLWFWADKPQFWPMLSDNINRLFSQLVCAPATKSLGYGLTIATINICHNKIQTSATSKTIDRDGIDSSYQTNQAASFFNSLKTATEVVSFRKIRRFPRMFYNYCYPISPEENHLRLANTPLANENELPLRALSNTH